MRNITIISQATEVTQVDLDALVSALQVQVDQHFGPAYLVDCQLAGVMASPTAPHTVAGECIYLLDHSDQAGALGYHEDTAAGVPVGYAFVADTIADGMPWQPTCSHELLEQLADPFCDSVIPVRLSAAFGRDARKVGIVAYEVADPCEDDVYTIGGVPVSNFVLPAWFAGGAGPWDYMQRLTAPLTLDKGGYVSYSTTLTGWKEVTDRGDFTKHSYSRFHRRRRRHKARRAA